MAGMSTTLITLNVNGLDNPIKRHKLADGSKNQNTTVWCIKETRVIQKEIHRLKIKG